MSVDQIFSHRHSLANMNSAMSSSASDTSSIVGYTSKKLAIPRSSININLENHYSSKVYTSLSPVSGKVSITTKRDVRFDSIQILLMGTTTTRVEGVNSPHQVTHTFLKVAMPIPESSYPVPRILESGHTYTIPFNFVIPSYLTDHACNHHILSENVRGAHVLLPPSMGFWEKDDLAPQMAEVEYAIKARVFREEELGGKKIKVMEASQRIRVLPASVEEPPLNLTKHDKLYALSKSKTLKKNILSGKLGRLTAEAAQPPAVVVRPDGRGAASSTARVQLRFDPASTEMLPPKITGVSAKVVGHTFYSSGTIPSLPNLGDWNKAVGADRRGSYSTSVALTGTQQQPVATAWVQQLYAGVRRDSGYSSESPEAGSDDVDDLSCSDRERASAPLHHNHARRERTSKSRKGSSSSNSSSPLFHTTTISVPIVLPVDRKTFIPTFHSCIASRVYVLQLSISIGGSGSSSTTLSLAVPLQVVVGAEEGPAGTNADGLPSFEVAVGEAEADEYLRPRVIQVPDAQFRETSLLPGYGASR